MGPASAAESTNQSTTTPQLIAAALLEPKPAEIQKPAESAGEVYPIDLPTAFRLAEADNPLVAFARQQLRQALALEDSARVLWLPTLRAGVSLYKHDGRLQETEGRVFEASRSAFYAGGGNRAAGSSAPAIPGVHSEFHLADAIFAPLATRQHAWSKQAASRAATNDVLLEVALAYQELLRSAAELEITEETRNHAKLLADLTKAFAESGQGLEADSDRAQTELAVRQNDFQRAAATVGISSARLAQHLRLDPTLKLAPTEPQVVPLRLVSHETPLSELVAQGLESRPELHEAQHLVTQAVIQLRREKCAPLLPSAYLRFSFGSFGGGAGDRITNTSDRIDLDTGVYWELRNFGCGELAARRYRQAELCQAHFHQIAVMDQVSREVVEAQALVLSRYQQIAVAQGAIETATNSYERNLNRIMAAQGLPIEVMQSIQALAQARQEYLRTLIDYNSAQFTLLHALGWPVDALASCSL